ncbi:unnamed protein product [Blepharisma stoltei]|uniref:Uncharacterized protein n=1 Tax=Blepharisma stoltei TaxID=1481888 RepID=A0AAU9ICD6_9CILI|nr:unnamed protein product [Blepharisma stoltei]
MGICIRSSFICGAQFQIRSIPVDIQVKVFSSREDESLGFGKRSPSKTSGFTSPILESNIRCCFLSYEIHFDG